MRLTHEDAARLPGWCGACEAFHGRQGCPEMTAVPAPRVRLAPSVSGDWPQITEADFLARVRGEAGAQGWEVYHTHDSRRSEAGFPDLVMVRAPVTAFAELKRDRRRPSEAQWRWLDALETAGQVACLWRPSDWPEIAAFLRTGIDPPGLWRERREEYRRA